MRHAPAYTVLMSSILTLATIQNALRELDVLPLIEAGFVAYSRGQVILPPVGELVFPETGGDCHIKYGFVRGDDIFVIKIANYFPANTRLGTSPDDGMMLVFDQKTGSVRAVLMDHGYLTHVRTAAAGAIAAKYLAPQPIRRIGILGTGMQARLQLKALKTLTDCREVALYGRNPERLAACRDEMAADGFAVQTCTAARDVASECNLIVTTTSARTPLLSAADIRPGTHITAMGSDSANKQELDAGVLTAADILVVDSVEHAKMLGELQHVPELVSLGRVRELGAVIANPTLGRTRADQRTVADLVGLAIQDIQIAKAVYLQAITSS
jgi:ornithine cyclodeaminase